MQSTLQMQCLVQNKKYPRSQGTWGEKTDWKKPEKQATENTHQRPWNKKFIGLKEIKYELNK